MAHLTISRKQRTWLRRMVQKQLKSTFMVSAVGMGIMLGAATLPAMADDSVNETNVEHQSLTDDTVVHFGDDDVSYGSPSNNNSNTVTIDGIDAEDNARAYIGGAIRQIEGDNNSYQVIINTRAGDDYAIDVDYNARAFLSGGQNSVDGNDNSFINTVNGDINVYESTFILDAGTIAATSQQSTGNHSGNVINGDISATDGMFYIYGQTTDVASGSNVSSNHITGDIDAEGAYVQFSGHHNVVKGAVNLYEGWWDTTNLLVGQFDDISNASSQNLENSLTVEGGVNADNYTNVIVAIGGITLHGDDNKITNKLVADISMGYGGIFLNNEFELIGDNNEIINSIEGVITGTDIGVQFDQFNASVITGNNNILRNELSQNLELSDDDNLWQSAEMEFINASNNIVDNSVTGDVVIKGNYVWQGRDVLYVDENSAGNQTNNIITGNVLVQGELGYLEQIGGSINNTYRASDDKGNQATNVIDGQLTVDTQGRFFVNGERNIVTQGVYSSAGGETFVGSSDVFPDDAIGSIIHNESSADHFLSLGGSLHLGSNDGSYEQVFEGDNYQITNRVIGDAEHNVSGTITVSDSGILGLGDGLHDSAHGGEGDLYFEGSGNVITNYVGENQSTGANQLSAQLQTITDGGKVLLGGRNILSDSAGNAVNNIVDQDVILGADDEDNAALELAGRGASSTVGANAVTVTNRITGNVTVNGDSLLWMHDGNASDAHNIVDGTVTLKDRSLLIAMNAGNSVGGSGILAQNNSIAQIVTNDTINESTINGGFELRDDSQLWLGNHAAFEDAINVASHISDNHHLANGSSDGSVSLIDRAALKVLSGGTGGVGSAAGSNVIDGDVTFGANTIYQISLSADRGATGITVNGAVHLGGAHLWVNDFGAEDDYEFGAIYNILHADGGVTGTFSAVTDNLALALVPQYADNDVNLVLGTRFHELTGTRNELALAYYLDEIVNGAEDLSPELNDKVSYLANIASSGNLAGLANFTGDSYAAFDAAAYWNKHRFTNTVARHARQSHNSDWTETFALNAQQGVSGMSAQMSLVNQLLNAKPVYGLAANGASTANNSGLWGDIAGDWLRNDGDSHLGSPDWNVNSKSVILGYQSGSDSFRWGLTGGYRDGDLDFNNRSARGEMDGWSVGVNGLWQTQNGMYVNGVLSYNRDSNELTRNDAFGVNEAKFNSRTIAGLLEVGKHLNRKNYTLTPYVSLLGGRYSRSDVTERGTGVGLNIDDASRSYLTSSLGVRIGKDFQDRNGQKRGGVMLGVSWQHQFSGTNLPVTASLQGAPGSSHFTVHGTPLSGNSLGLQLGAYGRLTGDIFGFLNYSGNFGSNQKAHSVAAGMQYQF